MKEKKQALLAEADRISGKVAKIQQQLRGRLTEENEKRLEDRLNRLTQRYYAIVGMFTWPVDKRIRRWFVANNLVLFLPVVTQAYSALNSSQHFLG